MNLCSKNLVSNFAFKFNLYRCTTVEVDEEEEFRAAVDAKVHATSVDFVAPDSDPRWGGAS